jgi:hypothetical protein
LRGDDLGALVQQRFALVGQHFLPLRARAVRRGQSVLDVLGACLRDACKHFAGGRIDVVGDAALASQAPGAVDIHRMNGRVHKRFLL